MTNFSKIKFQVEKTNTGYSAYAVEFPIFTTGGTLKELHENALEATQLYFEDEDPEKLRLSDLEFKME